MKAIFNVNSSLQIELEFDSQADLFRKLSKYQEIFGESTVINKDGVSSDKVRYVVRTVDDNDYYELQCTDDSKPELKYAKKKFGMKKGKEQDLFPKSGWVKYDKAQNAEFDILTGKKVEKSE